MIQQPAPPPADLVTSLDTLTTAAGTTTRQNRILPQPAPAPAIPARVGTATYAGSAD
jgi:hypothetical protein